MNRILHILIFAWKFCWTVPIYIFLVFATVCALLAFGPKEVKRQVGLW